MKKLFGFALIPTLLALSFTLKAQPRTDGPVGSEYGSHGAFDGELQWGLQFGSLLSRATDQDGELHLSTDLDYRPYEIFGFRLTGLYQFNTPQTLLFSASPVAHTEISNLRPYLILGPTVAFIDNDGWEGKFGVMGGVGGDIMLTPSLGFGMLYSYHSLLDAYDLHHLSARLVFAFQ